MDSPIIEVKDLCFSYNGHSVLEAVNFDIPEKGFVGLLGPNGGGKTTLLKLMLGLLKPDRGIIRIFGDPPRKNADRIGYVPQEIGFNKSFPISVADVVLMGRLKRGKSWASHSREDKAAADKILETLRMSEHRNKRIGELSGGQRQRVFIARALINDPEILFLDEPTASVDPQGQAEFYELLKSLNARATIVMVSHDVMIISSYIKSIACVNHRVHYHNAAEITQEMTDMYCCPVEVITHGKLPHRVLRKHEDF